MPKTTKMLGNKTTFEINKTNLFAFRSHSHYINFWDLFLLYFNEIPNTIYLDNIDCKKAKNNLEITYGNEVQKDFYFKRNYSNEINSYSNEYYYVFDKLIIIFHTENNYVYIVFTKKVYNKAQTIINEIISFKKRKKQEPHEIYLLINTQNGIDITSLIITKPKLKIEDNYNDDFIETHQNIIKRLSKNNDKGIVLLHGKPGTGKTFYIRYLIAQLKKKVIFLPPNMTLAITNPDFLSVLIENPNSIFVIEDAENIVLDREQHGSSAVSTLLNLSDGLLSDCLNIQIVCSFNTDISKIDAALMRKGRLIAKYEFKALEVDKAQQLSDKLGFKTKITNPTILTDIYNQNENEFKESKNKIGF